MTERIYFQICICTEMENVKQTEDTDKQFHQSTATSSHDFTTSFQTHGTFEKNNINEQSS